MPTPVNFQYVFDNASGIKWSYQDVTTDVVTRSGQAKTGRIVGTRPYQFEVTIRDGLKYTDGNVLQLLSHIEENAGITNTTSSTNSYTIDIGSTNSNLSYITAYQGNCSTAYLESLNFYPTPGILDNSASGSTVTPSYKVITLQEANTTHRPGSASTVIFEKGDWIQLNYTGSTGTDTNQQIPYQVMETVTFGDKYAAGNGFYDVKINRHYYGKFGSGAGGITTPHVKVGSNVSFDLFLIEKPQYTFMPGDLVQFDRSFKFIESI